MAITRKEYPIVENKFEYDGKTYDCSLAIERDTNLIIKEAETSHKDSFDTLYDRKTLQPSKVRLFFNQGHLLYGMVLYTIQYRGLESKRSACGGYYPLIEGLLLPHPYQTSICW